MSAAAAADAVAALDRNDAALAELVATARHHLARGRLDAAATVAQVAGQHAWTNHTGRFASPELEALLAALAARLAPAPARSAPPRADPRDVLHVVTQAYQTGGSTREIACWLAQDAGRRQRLCITRQGATPPPAFLAGAFGDDLVRLDTARGGLMARAAALRRLAATVDVVVLHVHPYDVVPVIAFAGGTAPAPVVLVNQADHVFWLGTGVADVLFNMRESGRRLALARRGIAEARMAVMARPLMPAVRTIPREEAKRRLGLDTATVVLATAADASKYRPVGGDRFLDLVLPALERHPEAVLLAAGPADDGAWAEARVRTGGRLRALGRLPDLTELHEATDVYLDSFPFSSLTSLLEAGSAGALTMTYRGHPEDCGVLGAEVPGVDPYILAPDDPAGFDAALERAIVDAPWRADQGARTAEAIWATHTGDGWRADVDAVYARAAELAATARPVAAADAPREVGRLDVLVRDVMVQTGFATGADGALAANLGLLPLPQRARAVASLAAAGRRPAPKSVLSEWALPALAGARRGLQARRARLLRPRGAGVSAAAVLPEEGAAARR